MIGQESRISPGVRKLGYTEGTHVTDISILREKMGLEGQLSS